MDSYGTILKNAREEKKLDIDTASRETSITVEYLKALESEDSGIFPGETYLTGFLQNYAEYLGLKSESVLALYRSRTIQEEAVPEGLYEKQKPGYFWPLVILFSVIGATMIVAGIWLFIKFRSFAKTDNVLLADGSVPREYELSDTTFSMRLFRGDKLMYPTESDSGEGRIILTVSGTLSSFGLDTPVGTLYTELGEEKEFDIDGDGRNDIIVYVSDISSQDASRGAEVRVNLSRNSVVLAADEIASEEDLQQAHEPRVILEDNRAYPFTVSARFRGSCLFRYSVDRRPSEEQYYTSGDTINIISNNRIRLWMSNSNTVTFTIIAGTQSFNLEPGRAGQVLVEDILWVRTSEGRYRLVVIELD